MTTPSEDFVGICFRYQDNDNFLALGFDATKFYFYRELAAARSAQGVTYAITAVDGTTYNIRVVAVGTSLLGYLDGVLRATATLSDFQTATPAGLVFQRLGATVPQSPIDNFIVRAV